MIAYNPKDWFKLIWSFHKSDTFRMLIPAMLGVGIYTAIWTFLEVDLFQAKFKSTTVVHSLLGFIISLLLVFRTNTAYERWWEGRKLWGSMINNCRNLGIKLNAFVPKEHKAERESLRILINNYVYAAKEHLRTGVKEDELIAHPAFKEGYSQYSHVPNMIAARIFEEVEELSKKGIIHQDKWIVMNEELRSFTEIIGACERIKTSPIPYSYSMFIKKIIFIYTLTMPVGFIIDFRYWTIPVVIFTFYAFASLELIAEEIEDPFGGDANDLPLDEIAAKIKKNLDEILK